MVLPTEFLTWSGHLGVVLYIVSYAGLQAGLLRGSGYAYTLCNLFAASFVLIGLGAAFNLSAALIQIFWILISLLGLVRIILTQTWVQFTSEEVEMIESAFPDMPKSLARRVLKRGEWCDLPAEHVLVQEGAPVLRLAYLLRGEVEVLHGGETLARPHEGFIGEMNVMEGGAASATVITRQPCRVFVITGDALRGLARKDAELSLLLENALSRAIRHKLIGANRQLALRDIATA